MIKVGLYFEHYVHLGINKAMVHYSNEGLCSDLKTVLRTFYSFLEQEFGCMCMLIVSGLDFTIFEVLNLSFDNSGGFGFFTERRLLWDLESFLDFWKSCFGII